VELCECCLKTGYSANTIPEGQVNLDVSTWERERGAWIGVFVFGGALLALTFWYFQNMVYDLFMPPGSLRRARMDRFMNPSSVARGGPKRGSANLQIEKEITFDEDEEEDRRIASKDGSKMGDGPSPAHITPIQTDFPEDDIELGETYRSAVAPIQPD